MTETLDMCGKHAVRFWAGRGCDICTLENKSFEAGRLQGLEEAAKIADQWAESLSCGKHSDNPCCHVFTGVQISAAIREKIKGAACRAPAPQPAMKLTRFAEFDDDEHPFRQWWLKHGHFMLSGGGRRESIWAARGWIAREQLACGVEVTGDSMHEQGTSEQAPQVTPDPVKHSLEKYGPCLKRLAEEDVEGTSEQASPTPEELGLCSTSDWPHLTSDGTGRRRMHAKRDSCTAWHSSPSTPKGTK